MRNPDITHRRAEKQMLNHKKRNLKYISALLKEVDGKCVSPMSRTR
jgi:hypothetical protein